METEYQYQTQLKPKRNTPGIIIGAILIMGVLIFLAFKFAKPNPEDSSQHETISVPSEYVLGEVKTDDSDTILKFGDDEKVGHVTYQTQDKSRQELIDYYTLRFSSNDWIISSQRETDEPDHWSYIISARNGTTGERVNISMFQNLGDPAVSTGPVSNKISVAVVYRQ